MDRLFNPYNEVKHQEDKLSGARNAPTTIYSKNNYCAKKAKKNT